ncbi:MAG: MFS transporter [Proteobacteria bacterium]|nr:MFS transporter [Pseudomonadota bacterium]
MTEKTQKIENLPLWKKIMWAVGQFGWSMTTFAVFNLLTYFYLPPETGDSTGIPPLIFQGTIIGVMTIIGLASFGGRFFDAITDPWIAGISDRSTSRWGRRRFFLMISVVPFALFSALVFFPPFPQPGPGNTAWVITTITLFYIFNTMYTIPFTALVPELGHTSKERLFLSTIGSVAWALGFFVGQATWLIKGLLQSKGFSAIQAMQSTITFFAILGFVAMLVPIIFIDEKRYCKRHVSREGTLEGLIKAFGNRDFRRFTLADFSYFVSNTILEIGIVYYVTVLMGLKESLTFTLMAVMFILSFVFYPAVVKVTNAVGKKKIMFWAFLIQVGIYIAIAVSGLIPGINPTVWGWSIILIESIPVAIFGIIPTAMVSDIAKADGIRTGNYKEGIFMGARCFMMKFGASFANLIFPSMLILGRSIENPLGVRMTAIVALGFNLLGIVMLLSYSEKRINLQLAKEESQLVGEI